MKTPERYLLVKLAFLGWVRSHNSDVIGAPEERQEHCPRKCTCRFDHPSNGTITVYCQRLNLRRLPKVLPKGLLELHFENNLIDSISSSVWLGNVTGLYLSHNNIQQLNASTLRGLTRIKNLYLDNNKLKGLPTAIKDVPFKLLNIQDNPVECDCEAEWMKDWPKNNSDRIVGLHNTRCHNSNTEGSKLIADSEFKCKNLAYVFAALTALLLTIIIFVFVCIKFRKELKVLMYTHFNCHPFDRLNDSDPSKIYDAFVSYSGHDHAWVWNTLAEKLETRDPPYKLCIHDRDFELGAPIAENILNSVKQSKRTIVVLSRNFIRSEWCLLEFRAAHRRVLEERMRYLIVILLEDLNTDELDSEIQLYMRTNTYLSVDNKWFWQKLFYAMPRKEKRDTEPTEPRKKDLGLFEENNTATAENALEIGIV